ncbi:hypothetical protein AB3S75_015749 [Citrus x aurantiifolia]
MLFYTSSTKFQLSSVAENGCLLSVRTDNEIKRFFKRRQKYGDFESNAVPMREISCGHQVLKVKDKLTMLTLQGSIHFMLY